MNKRTCMLLVIAGLAFSFTLAIAGHHTAAERGKTHFSNPSFAGGKKPCSTCHPGGKGLEDASSKSTDLEGMINRCIVNANKGNSLEKDSTEMQELVSYIKSLGAESAPGYGK